MAYLTYLVDHYSALPAIIAFVHPHRDGYPTAWHTDADGYNNAKSLNGLKLDYVKEHGYANLRCIYIPGCPDEIQPFRSPYEEHRTAEHAMIDTWAFMFGNESQVPAVLATPCCSQFAVSRDQVLARPRSDYLRYRDWLIETTLDDATSGRIMEYLWHVIFGRDPVQ